MWRPSSILIGIVILLVAGGLVMLGSTSTIHGQALYKDSYFFIKRQVAAIIVGFFAAFIAARMDYSYWRKFAIPVTVLTIVLLALVLSPLGISVKGSTRWLDVGPVNLQPSELAKFATVLFLSWWMARAQRRSDELMRGLIAPLLTLGVMALLILKEPDFGTTMLISCVGAAVMFVGGSRFGHLAIAGTLGLSGISLMILQDAERTRRILAFQNPTAYEQDEAYQLLQALYGFVDGGLSGVGLGAGLQKRYYLPEAHTDFIFAIVGEEGGLIFTAFTVLLFLGILCTGLWISWKARDRFGRLLAFGITFSICVQAALNVAVVTGCMPTKGIPLPFISYGGTSMVIMLSMVGVLVNIASQPAIDSEESEIADPSPRNSPRKGSR